MNMQGTVNFSASFVAGSGRGEDGKFKKGVGELRKVAKTFLSDQWSNTVRDTFAKSWAKTAAGMILSQIDEQSFFDWVRPLSEYTVEKKRAKQIDNGILYATGQLKKSLVVRKTGVGSYSIRWKGMSSSPFNSDARYKIPNEYLASILEMGAIGVGRGNKGAIPPRPFFGPGLREAASFTRREVGNMVYSSFFSSFSSYSSFDDPATIKNY